MESRNARWDGHVRPHWNAKLEEFKFPGEDGRCVNCGSGACSPIRMSVLQVLPRHVRRWPSGAGTADMVTQIGKETKKKLLRKKREGFEHPAAPTVIERESRDVFKALLSVIPRQEMDSLDARVFQLFQNVYQGLLERAHHKMPAIEFLESDDEFLMQSKTRYVRMYGFPRLKRLLQETFEKEPWSSVPRLRPHLERYYRERIENLIRRGRRALKAKPLLTRRGKTPTGLADLFEMD